ncbi:MAG: hypothetical protein U1D30_16825 [Planctomycetota bacterium]
MYALTVTMHIRKNRAAIVLGASAKDDPPHPEEKGFHGEPSHGDHRGLPRQVPDLIPSIEDLSPSLPSFEAETHESGISHLGGRGREAIQFIQTGYGYGLEFPVIA